MPNLESPNGKSQHPHRLARMQFRRSCHLRGQAGDVEHGRSRHSFTCSLKCTAGRAMPFHAEEATPGLHSAACAHQLRSRAPPRRFRRPAGRCGSSRECLPTPKTSGPRQPRVHQQPWSVDSRKFTLAQLFVPRSRQSGPSSGKANPARAPFRSQFKICRPSSLRAQTWPDNVRRARATLSHVRPGSSFCRDHYGVGRCAAFALASGPSRVGVEQQRTNTLRTSPGRLRKLRAAHAHGETAPSRAQRTQRPVSVVVDAHACKPARGSALGKGNSRVSCSKYFRCMSLRIAAPLAPGYRQQGWTPFRTRSKR